MRLLLVSYNWPPRNAIGTLRPYSFAKTWAQNGVDVTVLTSKKKEFDEPLDLDLGEVPSVEVIEVAYGHGGNFLFSLFKHPRVRKLAKGLNRLFGQKLDLSVDVRQLWSVPAGALAAELAMNFDVVVSTFGPAASHHVACEVKKANPDIVWFADYRDLWADNPQMGISEERRLKLREIESDTVGRWADIITTVSNGFADKLEAQLGKRPFVIANGFDISLLDLEKNIERAQWASFFKPRRIVYTGTIYKGSQTPEPLLKSLVDLTTRGEISNDEVVVEFYGGRVEVAEVLARNPCYAPFVRLMGHVPRDIALQAQKEADLLLLLESDATEDNGVLTGKVYEYLASGRPILSLGSIDGSEIAMLLASTRAGVCCGTDQSTISEVIMDVINSETSPSWYLPRISKIREFSRKNQASKYLQLIKDNIS